MDEGGVEMLEKEEEEEGEEARGGRRIPVEGRITGAGDQDEQHHQDKQIRRSFKLERKIKEYKMKRRKGILEEEEEEKNR